jgi:hypothetical protein
VVEVIAPNLVRGDLAAASDLDVSELAKLSESVVEHPDPRSQAREPRLERDAAAKLTRLRLGEHHVIPTLAE